MAREPMYSEAMAARVKPGTPHRPSNGTEGDMFAARWCRHCTKDDYEAGMYCPIIAASMAFDVDDEGYPPEWTHDRNGQPCCTAFQGYDDLLGEGDPVPVLGTAPKEGADYVKADG